MTILRDGLAEALRLLYDREEWLTFKAPQDADAILSDPDFREDLVEAIAEAMDGLAYPTRLAYDERGVWVTRDSIPIMLSRAEEARAIVARMLGD